MSEPACPLPDQRCDDVLRSPAAEPERSSSRGAIAVVAVMFGWLLVVFGMAAGVSRNDPNIEVPVEIGLGVIVTPADGWYSAEDEWDVGQNGVALQKAGVYVAFWADEYQGTNYQLMNSVLGSLRTEFESFRALPATAVTVAGDLPGLLVYFRGVTEWGDEENEVVVVTYQGIGVVMFAETLVGRLGWAQDDIDAMLSDLVIPR